MCDECRQIPCHPRCPNAAPPKVRGTCLQCGEELLDGYDYYVDDERNTFCSSCCAADYHGIKCCEWEDEIYYESGDFYD